MATWLSENLKEREVVSTGDTRLTGWSLTNTGTEARFVAFKDRDKTGPMIVVPAGDEKNMTGLDQPFPNGLAIESPDQGGGKLIANVFFKERSDEPSEETDSA